MSNNIGQYIFILGLIILAFVMGMKYAPHRTSTVTVPFDRWVSYPDVVTPVQGHITKEHKQDDSSAIATTVQEKSNGDSTSQALTDWIMTIVPSYQSLFVLPHGKVWVTSRPFYHDAILDSIKIDPIHIVDSVKVPQIIYDEPSLIDKIEWGLIGGAAVYLYFEIKK